MLTRLRQPLKAIPVLTAALDRFDHTHAQDKALYMTWLAEAYLKGGQDRRRSRRRQRSTRPVQRRRVCTSAQRLSSIIRQLARHWSVPSVAALLDRAAPPNPAM